MKTLVACCAVLLPALVVADEPARLPTDGRFVLELGLEVKNDSAQGELKTTLISEDAQRLTTGDEGFVVAIGGEELRAHVTAEAVTNVAPRQFCVSVKLRHKEDNVGGATVTVLDGQQGQVRVTLNGDSKDRIAILLAVTVGDPHPPAEERGPSSAEERRIGRALERTVSLRFENVPLHRVISDMRDKADINVVVDNAGLEEEGITSETLVSIDVRDVRLNSALDVLLRPMNLAHSVKDEVLMITSHTRAQGPLTVITYPVADLLVPVPQVINAHVESDPADRGKNVVTSAAEPGRRPVEFRQLVDLVTATVEPGSWEQVGGYGVIRPSETTLSLVVRQTEGVHDQIASLLRRMREEQDEQVALETTLFSVPAGAAKDLGFDQQGVRRLTAEERNGSFFASLWHEASTSRERLPTITFFNGQTGRIQTEITRDGREESLWMSIRPQIVAGVGVRLGAAPGTSLEDAQPVTVPDGQAVLMDVTPPATGAGSPIIVKRAGGTRTFKAERSREERLLLLVTPRIIKAEADATSATAPGAKRSVKEVRQMGSHYFTLDVF